MFVKYFNYLEQVKNVRSYKKNGKFIPSSNRRCYCAKHTEGFSFKCSFSWIKDEGGFPF